MKYRYFKGNDISQLGFGAMRLPQTEAGLIDVKLTEELFMYAYEHGVNYYDTAYVYHGGNSEVVLGDILKANAIRDKVFVADKLPTMKIDDNFDALGIFDEQLSRLQTDYIDFYLLHAMSADKWRELKRRNIITFMDSLKSSGQIKYMGFSFHDTFDAFKTIIDDYDWDFCQIQYNYMDTDIQAGTKGLEYAALKNIPVTIMEPLKGGKLLNIRDPYTTQLKAQYGLAKTPISQVCLDFVFNRPEVLCVLSGMNSMEQLKENIESASQIMPNAQPKEERRFLDELKNYLSGKDTINCTACRYCTDGCPESIDIPKIFEAYNESVMFDTLEQNRGMVARRHANIADCEECGQCEGVCPQGLPIIDNLAKIRKYFAVEA